MTADGHGGQRIIDTEFAWKVDLYVQVHQSCGFIGDTQAAASCHHTHICSSEIRVFPKTVGLQGTGVTFDDTFQMLIVPVYYAHTALL